MRSLNKKWIRGVFIVALFVCARSALCVANVCLAVTSMNEAGGYYFFPSGVTLNSQFV